MEKQTKEDTIGLGIAYLGLIVLSIMMMTGVFGMYAGESQSFITELNNPVYVVVDNSSNLDGLTVEFKNGNITISTVVNYKPDNFSLIFFDNVTNEVEVIVNRGGGGGSRTKYVDRIVNQTVYVPEYVDKIVEVNVSDYSVFDFDVTDEDDNKNFWAFVMGSLFIIAVCFFGWLLRRKNKEEDDDGRDEDNTTTS